MSAIEGRKLHAMHSLRSLLLLACSIPLVACSDEPEVVVTVLPIQGAAIVGSDDVPAPLAEAQASVAESTDVEVVVGTAEELAAAALSAAQIDEAEEPPQADETADQDGAPIATTDAADGEVQDPADAETDAETDAEAVDPELAAKLAAIPEPGEDGVYPLAFTHLSLEGEDIDNIIDYLLFPDEFEEGEGFEFPAHIRALESKQITISGYMIPGRIRKNMVRDFMLVRDLAGCCFGGAPNPDEWIDVVMVDDAEAEYLRYLPITVRGKLELIGDQDQEGYAVGVYRLKATWAGEKD